MTKIKKTVLLGVIIVTTAVLAAAVFLQTKENKETYLLKVKYPPGKYYVTSKAYTESITDTLPKGETEEMPAIRDEMTKYLMEISEADAVTGTQKFKLTVIEFVVRHLRGKTEIAVYDSTDTGKQHKKLAPLYQSLTGSVFTFDLTKNNRIKNITGMKELTERQMPESIQKITDQFKKDMKKTGKAKLPRY